MIDSLFLFFTEVVTLIEIAVIVFGYFNKTYQDKLFKWVYYFMVLSLVTDIYSKILARLAINNLHSIHVFLIGEFIFFSLFFKELLKDYLSLKVIKGIAIVVIGFSIINSIFIQPIHTFNEYARSVEVVFILFYCFFYLLRVVPKVDNLKDFRLQKHIFLFVGATGVYFLSLFFFFSLGTLIQKYGLADFFALYYVLAAIIYFSLIIWVLWIHRKKAGSSLYS
ncbi:MAG: hypothetical protein SFU27_07550 [Thermonemataceae bacterium]|nr:hypothetical protein [Thermonemataceae bacterium]